MLRQLGKVARLQRQRHACLLLLLAGEEVSERKWGHFFDPAQAVRDIHKDPVRNIPPTGPMGWAVGSGQWAGGNMPHTLVRLERPASIRCPKRANILGRNAVHHPRCRTCSEPVVSLFCSNPANEIKMFDCTSSPGKRTLPCPRRL